MTSKQVMLTLAVTALGGCINLGVEPLSSPYPQRLVFAVGPLENESGSLEADGVKMADLLARQLETASNIDVLPVNRTLEAMEAQKMSRIEHPAQARELLATLGADALVVGTISQYDPYDPPKLGVAIELYLDPRSQSAPPTLNVRRLTKTASGPAAQAQQRPVQDQPVSVVSAFFDAASPDVRYRMRRYAHKRGTDVDDDGLNQFNPLRSAVEKESYRIYRISMDLYSQFVSYELSWRLLRAESVRLMPAGLAQVDP